MTEFSGEGLAPNPNPEADPLRGYQIDYIDRGAQSLETFVPLDGKGPIRRLAEICKGGNRARILSAGAGTGHQLYDWIQSARVLYLPERKTWSIDGVAVNDHDFSGMSRNLDVVKAFRTGALTYVQSKIEEYQPPKPFDIVTAYELLIHCPRPQDAVASLWRALGRHGVAYFNADPKQSGEIEEVLQEVRRKRWEVKEMEAELPLMEELSQLLGLRPAQRRINYMIAPLEPDEFLARVFDSLSKPVTSKPVILAPGVVYKAVGQIAV